MIKSFTPPRARGRLRMPLAATAALAVVAACGCSSGDVGWRYGAAPSRPPAPRAGGGPGGAVLALRHTALGTILTTGGGLTVYTFEADHGTTSACTGACAATWPPVTTSGARITVAGGAGALAGQISRPGGVHQLTYGGHRTAASPGRWDVLTAAGQEVTSG